MANPAANDPKGGVMEFVFSLPEGTLYTVEKDLIGALNSGTEELAVVSSFDKELRAPIKKDETYGTAIVRIGDEVIYRGALIASRDMYKAGDEDLVLNAEEAPPVQSMEIVDPEEIYKEETPSLLWWLLLPAGLIAFIIIRAATVKRKRRIRFKKRRTKYNYKIK